ncbi:probable glutamate--tRNA ligase, mitochondrial [Amyelois transitella]|uniref:probable glutamate--tRNA ligase, mitochondrial n=1 Tax=Amyelois transitella TaxID=680683 RepID=UPI00298FA54F|nr:probable glutamate--tRNA ligase, mitochondrial [Amyelois transitella]
MKSTLLSRLLSPATVNRCRKSYLPRVRFAPSPTGYLHLGGLRTALYNYLFAKSHQGAFLLRIEDTDQKRKVEGAVEVLIKDLQWAGVECDEGPGLGGKYGPYVQSERLEIYKDHIEKLLDNGSAYRCFCTERRLNLIRRDALKHQRVPKYDNRCRSLTDEEIKEKIKAGTPYCIRFKLSSDCQSFEDLIFGGIAYDVSLNEGDPVLMKSDGFPTYHFANVVDDHLMEVTHVLRGVEWQISTTKHLLIYKAFGWTPPQFGHLPLIINSDGTKLSKRQGDVTVEDYKKNGVFPLALVNYITLSGGGFEHVPGAGVSLKTMEELASEFQIGKVLLHPSRLNPELLQECNRLEMKRQLSDPDLCQSLVRKVQNLVKQTYPNEIMDISDQHVRNVLKWATARVTRVEDLVSTKFGFLWILPSNNFEIDKELLRKLLEHLENVDRFEQDLLKNNLREFAVNNNVKFPMLMKMLRGLLSGLSEGPGVAEMMQLLGKGQSLERIKSIVR